MWLPPRNCSMLVAPEPTTLVVSDAPAVMPALTEPLLDLSSLLPASVLEGLLLRSESSRSLLAAAESRNTSLAFSPDQEVVPSRT